MSSSFSLALASSLVLLTAAPLALAEPAPVALAQVASTADALTPTATDAVAPPLSPSPSGLVKGERVDAMGHIGVLGGKGYSGALLGASLLARQGQLTFGGTFEGSSSWPGSRLGGGLVAGWSYRQAGGLGLDLLGVGGVHRYQGIGRALLSSDPGVDATLPFVGARGRVSYRLGQGTTQFQLGASVFAEQDLGRAQKSSTYDDALAGSTTSEHTVGFTTAGLMLDLGTAFE